MIKKTKNSFRDIHISWESFLLDPTTRNEWRTETVAQQKSNSQSIVCSAQAFNIRLLD